MASILLSNSTRCDSRTVYCSLQSLADLSRWWGLRRSTSGAWAGGSPLEDGPPFPLFGVAGGLNPFS